MVWIRNNYIRTKTIFLYFIMNHQLLLGHIEAYQQTSIQASKRLPNSDTFFLSGFITWRLYMRGFRKYPEYQKFKNSNTRKWIFLFLKVLTIASILNTIKHSKDKCYSLPLKWTKYENMCGIDKYFRLVYSDKIFRKILDYNYAKSRYRTRENVD